MKGISREVVPYAIDGLLDADGHAVQVFSEHRDGLDLYLDLGRIDASASRSLRSVFQKAIAALDHHHEKSREETESQV
jgi:adenylate cyclase